MRIAYLCQCILHRFLPHVHRVLAAALSGASVYVFHARENQLKICVGFRRWQSLKCVQENCFFFVMIGQRISAPGKQPPKVYAEPPGIFVGLSVLKTSATVFVALVGRLYFAHRMRSDGCGRKARMLARPP